MDRRLVPLTSTLFLAASLVAGAQSITNGVQQEDHFAATKTNYLVFLPQGYENSKQNWPLILFLHGSNESGTDLAKVKRNGPPKYVESHPDFPLILVSPQAQNGWDSKQLLALLNHVMNKYRVDDNRVYLTGLSMGGNAVWALATEHPKKFAAIVPVSGCGNLSEAKKLAALPTWVFHGEKDTIMPVECSQKMVAAIRAAGGSVKYTEFPNAHHNIWKKTYENPELYKWLLTQTR